MTSFEPFKQSSTSIQDIPLKVMFTAFLPNTCFKRTKAIQGGHSTISLLLLLRHGGTRHGQRESIVFVVWSSTNQCFHHSALQYYMNSYWVEYHPLAK